MGIFVGLAIYIVRISKAHSYLSNDPKACVNCHIMAPQYATWGHSSHREWASCNDCHVPHGNVFETYYFKAKDGLRHATYFTLRLEPQVIQIKSAGIRVVQENCMRCHDAETMNLHISRPALLEAYDRLGKDITQASHQEMRSLVCAQCHVEYYFDKREGRDDYLTFPWDNGFDAESIERYYDEFMFTDWVHAISKAPMIKAQHPGYEVYMTGIHAERGVSCADCHMPYISEGGIKYTDHHIQSPLNNVANSCQVCHREETMTLVKNVYDRQDQIIQNRDKLEELLVHAHVEAGKAWELGASEEQMQPVLMDIRHAQWRWDYAAAGHGSSFHSPVEISKVIGGALAIAQDARIKLARILAGLGHFEKVPYPDITTKEKAQEFIGLNVVELKTEKKEFLETVVPKWDSIAREREQNY
jgi:nitrite reductase (cytochrome c-552)